MIDPYYWTTSNGHKITIFLEEAALPYEIVPVNIGAVEAGRLVVSMDDEYTHRRRITSGRSIGARSGVVEWWHLQMTHWAR
jgi:hypothetical protein